MAELGPREFGKFFQAVHGHQPFQWQERLAGEVLQKGWHDVIIAPTACGKTVVVDLAVFELARQADLEPDQRTAARRICFVVDRRLVVDEVTQHARRLAEAIRAAAAGERDDPELRVVAQQLARLALNPCEVLRILRLRGGVYRDEGWAADPLTPTILVSTVDQIGSRLLFRGYGVGAGSRPIQAGLLAFDTRIILDEAHLSTAFGSALKRVRSYLKWAKESPVPEPRWVSAVSMSATIGEGGRTFTLRQREREDVRLRARLDARKLANLVEVKTESVTKEMRAKQPGKAAEVV